MSRWHRLALAAVLPALGLAVACAPEAPPPQDTQLETYLRSMTKVSVEIDPSRLADSVLASPADRVSARAPR